MVGVLFSRRTDRCCSWLRRAIEEIVDLGVLAECLERICHFEVKLFLKNVFVQFFLDRIKIRNDRFGSTEAEHGHPVVAHLDNL